MINKLDFDMRRFLEQPDVENLVDQLNELSQQLDFAMLKRLHINLIAPEGSGAFRIVDKFQSAAMYGKQVQVVDCQGRKFQSIIAEVMKGFNFGTRTLNFDKALTFNMIEGLMYFLHQKNFRTLLVFKNFYRLWPSEMLTAISCFKKLACKTAIVLHTTNESVVKLTNHRESSIKNIFQRTPRVEVRNLEVDELEKFCLDCGVLNQKVIEDLTDYKPELEVLIANLDDLRTELKK